MTAQQISRHLSAYRAVAGDLQLYYFQFEELESFARFGMRLKREIRKTMERDRRIREVFRQPRYSPIPVEEQIAVLLAATGGHPDGVPIGSI